MDLDDETDKVEMLVGDDIPEAPFPPGNDNLSAEVTEHTPPPAKPHPASPIQPIPSVTTPPYAPTPASVVFSLPSSLNSPNPESLHSDSEFIEENLNPRRSERKKKKTTKYSGADANIIASDEDMRKLDNAYSEGVKLFISAATSNGEPRHYCEATHPENPDSAQWKRAIQEELKSLQDHGVWKYIP